MSVLCTASTSRPTYGNR